MGAATGVIKKMISQSRKIEIKEEIGRLLKSSALPNVKNFVYAAGISPVVTAFVTEKYGVDTIDDLDLDQRKDLVNHLNKLLLVSRYANGNSKDDNGK